MKNSNGSKAKLKESSNSLEISARRRAEAQAAKIPLDVSEMPAQKIEEVVQELNLQNEALQRISQELEKSRDAYRELYEFAPVGYFTVTPDYRILEVNLTGCTMMGRRRQDLINNVFTRYLLPAYTDTFYLWLNNAEKSKVLIACEFQLHKKDGTIFPASARIGWTPEVGGKRQCRLAIMDVTEQKKAEAKLKEYSVKLEEANAQLQQFVYAASHDLREPLRMMTSFSESLVKYLKDKLDARAREYAESDVRAAVSRQSLLDEILVFSRVATQILPFQQVDMERVFQDVLVNLKVSIEETGATITHDKLPEIEADPAQMAQVLQNLISNATKFHCQGEQPMVHVSYKKDGEWIFYVKDNGIGIPQELFGRLFVIFSRLNPQEEYPGSGMGLAIAKRIAQRHGGRVWVESEPGKGSTFYFTVAINPPNKETGK